MNEFIAHYRELDGERQSVRQHLENVSKLCEQFARKIGLSNTGELIGLIHDFGKYGNLYQKYIRSAVGLLNPDIDDDFVDIENYKGKIDHSTAGAQWVWQQFEKNYGEKGILIGQILSVCIVSHHGGMIDCLLPNSKNDEYNGFLKRINKSDDRTHLKECLKNCDDDIIKRLDRIVSQDFIKELWGKIVTVFAPEQQNEKFKLKVFRIGFLTRFLFSCLIDADRIDSADFENPGRRFSRKYGSIDWQPAIDRLESKLVEFKVYNDVDKIRTQISDMCLKRANDLQGIYTLTVPTGGGKTYSSMRFALHHAKKHKLDHIFYIIPYISIIEQNAKVIRKAIENKNDGFSWVLEHHSNLEPEIQTWQSKLFVENWDSPIIFTTMVQFLEVLFGGGTRGARRLHNLANSLIIFDEIQYLSIKCVHLFNNAINFLVNHAGSTVIFCTATQPLLDGVNTDYGVLNIKPENELIANVPKLFNDLKRVNIVNLTKVGGWSWQELSELAIEQLEYKGNCLVVANTKRSARKMYEECRKNIDNENVFYLSTNLCPNHRKKILDNIMRCLDNKEPVLCISTQLIESGVDIDFKSVIRFIAGLDSIAQAGGRCNRNGIEKMADVFVVNPTDENVSMLKNIHIGQDKTMRIFSETEHEDFLCPEAIKRYFEYYFFDRQNDEPNPMLYPISKKQIGRNDTMLNLLSDNSLNIGQERDMNKAMFRLQQSFKTAGDIFKVINAPTKAIIVPYDEGKNIIAELCENFCPNKAFSLLKKAQRYSVNVFPYDFENLMYEHAIHQIQQGVDIYYLDEQYYSDEFGLFIN